MRRIAPAGTPISANDLFAWLKGFRFKQENLEQLKDAVCQHFNVKNCFLVSTGRAAMALLLRSFAEAEAPEKKFVVIPSYTCYSVPSSVYKAGLEVIVCDIDPNSLDYDYQKLAKIDLSKVLAIVSSNLYGLPNDLDRLEAFCQERQIYLLDDAAQCMGAQTSSDRYVGTFGDAGLFSLDKGKVITSMNGGIIITDSTKLAASISAKLEKLALPSLAYQVMEFIKMLAYYALLRPSLYSIPASLPFLNLGKTVYTTEYPIECYNISMASLALRLLSKIDKFNRQRLDNGTYFREQLIETDNLIHFTPPLNSQPIYLRYPILLKNNELRRKLLNNLQQSGIDATPSYPTAIVDIEGLNLITTMTNDYSGGRQVAKQIVTIPTHPYVSKTDRENIKNLINATLS